MRVGILSDTHDQLGRTQRAVALLQAEGAETLIHCGDLLGPAVVAACAALPCYFVFGNNDADNVPALQEAIFDLGSVCLGWGGEVVIAEKRIAVVHGHMHTDVRRLLALRPDYLLSGHSHIPGERQEGPTRRINPGALHRAAEYTVALLDLEIDQVQWLVVSR